MIEQPLHGGNLLAVAARYGVDAASLMDFSANIDPYGPAPAARAVLEEVARNPQKLCAYPEPSSAAARDAISAHLGIDAQCIAVGNGGASVIDAAVRTTAAPRALVPVPAFSEYARALRALGTSVYTVPLDITFRLSPATLRRGLKTSSASLVIITNPHNPTGALIARSDLCTLVAMCEEAGATVILDEAFIDYQPHESLARDLAHFPKLIIVRSLTKFYGIAGVRIGYALASEDLATSIRGMLPSWPVGAIEEAIAAAVLGDRDYAYDTIQRNAIAREELTAALAELGFAIAPSAANFVFADLPAGTDMDSFLEHCIRECHVVLRDCRNYEGLERRACVRIAVRTPKENAMLVDALREALG